MEKEISSICMASLDQRVKHLLPEKGRKEKKCLIEAALVFARSRDKWLTIKDLDSLMSGSGKKYRKSALYEAVSVLSDPMNSLNGHSYIDTTKVRPLRRKLSVAAYEKIFALIEPKQIEPKPHLHGLNGRGRIKIPPLVAEKVHEKRGLKYKQKVWLPPEDIINLVEQKIGAYNTNRLLRSLTSDQGIKYGEFAVKCESITKTHRWGRHPKQQFELTNNGLEKLLTDEDESSYTLDALVVDSREDQARVHALEERALKEEQALDELIQVMSSDAGKYARQIATHSLGRLHDKRAIEPLVKAMLSDEYSGVRSVAAATLEEFGYRQEFTMALKDSDSYVRREAATILGKIRDVRAVESLIEALQDSDIGVQCEAASALGQIGDGRAVDALIPLLGFENESARHAALTALRSIGGSRAIETLRNALVDARIENKRVSHVETYPAALLDNYIRRSGKNHELDLLGGGGKAEKK